jgi:hypothetical protein
MKYFYDKIYLVNFEDLTAVSIKITVFGDYSV